MQEWRFKNIVVYPIETKRKMASRPNSSSTKRPASGALSSRRKGGKENAKNTSRPPSGKPASNVLSKEEEYMRLNAELEAKTASLIKEAESVLHDQDELLSRPFQVENDYEADISESLGELSTNPDHVMEKEIKKKVRPVSAKNEKQPVTKSKRNRPRSAQTGQHKSSSGNTESSINEIVSRENLLDNRIQLANTISTLEDESQDTTDYHSSVVDDVLPETAGDLSSEAVTRFLKAKLRVMQEELDRVSGESITKDEKIASCEQKIKQLQEEQQRTLKTTQSLQGQSDKYKRLFEESKQKCDGLDGQLTASKKELDNIQRDQKQTVVSKNAIEIRLNRALEEVEKYKVSMQKQKTSTKDASDQEKRRTEQLVAENKRLEKQKSELMNAFKKQMKLIDILKRQKMHIEAAKLLSFTEEEFVKALDWGK